MLSLFGEVLKEKDAEYERLHTAVKSLSETQPLMRIVEAALVATRKDSARLDELLPKIVEEAKQPNSGGVQGLWPLASVLAHDCQMYQRAIDLLEPVGDKINERRNGNGIDFSPDGLLLYCYMQLKQNEKAKAILDQSVANPPIDPQIGMSNPGYSEYQLLQTQIAAAQKYVTMQYPLDALRLAIKVKDDKEIWQKASQWGGGNDSYYMQQLKTIESQSRKQITPEILESLLTSELTLVPVDARETSSDHKPTSLKSVVLELSFKENKDGKLKSNCLLKQLLEALPKEEKSQEMLKRILSTAMTPPLKDRSLGQLVMMTCVAIQLEDQATFQLIADEMLAREEVLSKAPQAIVPKPNKDGTELSAKEKAAAVAAAQSLERLERCGLWIAAEYSTQLKRNEQAEKLSKLAMSGFESKSIEAQKMKLQFAAMQVEFGKKSEAEATLRNLLDEILPPTSKP